MEEREDMTDHLTETGKQESVTDLPEDSPKRASSEALKESFSELVDAIDVSVTRGAKKRVKKETKTYFFKNNKRILKWATICAAGITIQVLRNKTRSQESKIQLLNIENQFLHFVISGLSNPEVDETEFSKEIAKRANVTQIVSEL